MEQSFFCQELFLQEDVVISEKDHRSTDQLLQEAKHDTRWQE